MTLTIGRASGLRPHTIEWQGGALRVEGTALPTTLAAKKVLRQQLLGTLDNIDEGHVPVIYTTDGSYDGLYRVEQVSAERVGVEGGKEFSFSATLVPARNRRTPTTEVVSSFITADNPHSIIGTVRIPYLPAPSLNALDRSVDRDTDSGDLYVAALGTVPAFLYPDAPSIHYNGSCKVELTADSGSTWDTFVGRNLITDVGQTGWRLNNGVIKVTAASNGRLTTEVFDGTTWEDSKTWKVASVDASTSSPTTGWSGLTILRNAPEVVVIRVYALKSASPIYGRTLDIALYRGYSHIETVSRWLGAQDRVSWELATPETTSAATGGIIATAVDADGHKFYIGTPYAFTSTLAQSRITSAYASSGGGDGFTFPAVLGYDIGGVGTKGAPDLACGVGSVMQRVIGL